METMLGRGPEKQQKNNFLGTSFRGTRFETVLGGFIEPKFLVPGPPRVVTFEALLGAKCNTFPISMEK